jgi:hypothetical protein
LESPFLNEQVTSDRAGFAFPEQSTDPNDITLGGIREAAVSEIGKDLAPYLDKLNQAKRDVVARFVAEEAPHYRWIGKRIDEFIDEFPAAPSKTEIETVLHREQYKREVELREESERILKQNVSDPEAYYAELAKFAQQFNEIGMSALAQHVVHRRVILRLLEKALAPDAKGNFFYEKVIHNLVFPMKTTSDDVPADRQNLWVIDETLSYHSFLASDKALKDIEVLESSSWNRPDIVIFNHPLAFTDGSEPLTSVILVEFKQPDRGEYKEGPLDQVYRLLDDIRAGKVRDRQGLAIQPASDRVPAYCYVICDITQKVKMFLENASATLAPDRQGYFGFNPNKTAYFEVISYRKLLTDAEKRNNALFDKLGLSRRI